MNEKYVPGSCNISSAEVKSRRQTGIIGLIITLVISVGYFGVVILFNVPPLMGVLVFFPLIMTFIGFLQARNKFCVAYGLGNVYNVSLSLGNTKDVTDETSKQKDRKKSYMIIAQAILFSVIITIVIVAIGFLMYVP